jgi:rubrerythrin
VDQLFKPITVVGLNSKKEIEFDINLVMKMFHAYIAYLPIEQRSPQEQLLLSKQLIAIQDLYNDEQKAAIEYIQQKAAEEEVKAAGIDVHYKERGPEEQNIDDLLDSVRKAPVDTSDKVESGKQFLENQRRFKKSVNPLHRCENCDGYGEVVYHENDNATPTPCPECGGSGYAK